MPGCPLRRTCARPLEGALRSKAEGELTLDLMSGEKRKRTPISCRSRLAAGGVPTIAVGWVHSWVKGRLSGRLREQASLLRRAKQRTRPSPLIRPSVSSPSAFDSDLPAPSGGRVEVLRSGQPGMDAGLAAPGQGWPMAAGPRSRTGAREHRALARGRTLGPSVLLTFGRLQK